MGLKCSPKEYWATKMAPKRNKKVFLRGGLVTYFNLDPNIIKMNILTKFEEDLANKTVAFRA